MRDLQQEFQRAYEAYSDELFRHCSLRLSDRERALEITQEAFVRVWEYVQKGQEVHEYRPFLYRTLRNLIIDEYRKAKSISLEGLVNEDAGESLEVLLPPDETNTLAAAVDRFEGKRAIEALKQVPEPYREAIALRYVSSLSPSEIAQTTGVSENVVSVRIHRGLKKLREILEPNSSMQ